MTTATLRPSLAATVHRRTLANGGLLLQDDRSGTSLFVPAPQRPTLEAMDGSRSLEQLEVSLAAASAGVAYQDLAILLFRLWDRDMLADGAGVHDALFPELSAQGRTATRSRTWRQLRRFVRPSIPMSFLLAPIRPLAGLARVLTGKGGVALLGLLATVAVVLVGAGITPWPERLFRLGDSWVTGILVVVGGFGGLLSLREALLAALLEAHGAGASGASLTWFAGVPHFDVDDAELAHLDRGLQLRFALAGLLLAPAIGGLLLLLHAATGSPVLLHLGATSLLVLLANACPLFVTDGSSLFDLLLRSRSGAGAAGQVRKAALSGLLDSEPGSDLEFALNGSAWFVWLFATVTVYARVVTDEALALQAGVLMTDSIALAAVGGAFLIYLLATAVGLLLLLVAVSLGIVRQAVAGSEHTQRRSGLAERDRRDLEAALQELGIEGLASRRLAAGEVLWEAGSPGQTVAWIVGGDLDLTSPGPGGVHRPVETAGAGAILGAEALSGGTRLHRILAATDCELLELPLPDLDEGGRATLLRAAELGAARALAGLSPGARLGVAATAQERPLEAGDVVVTAGEPADAVYVIRSGWVRVVKEGVEVARLHQGDIVGEVGVLFDRPRTATVEAVGAVSLLRLPADALREALLSSFRTGLAVEALAAHRMGA